MRCLLLSPSLHGDKRPVTVRDVPPGHLLPVAQRRLEIRAAAHQLLDHAAEPVLVVVWGVLRLRRCYTELHIFEIPGTPLRGRPGHEMFTIRMLRPRKRPSLVIRSPVLSKWPCGNWPGFCSKSPLGGQMAQKCLDYPETSPNPRNLGIVFGISATS